LPLAGSLPRPVRLARPVVGFGLFALTVDGNACGPARGGGILLLGQLSAQLFSDVAAD
jgi:hypothetical protein